MNNLKEHDSRVQSRLPESEVKNSTTKTLGAKIIVHQVIKLIENDTIPIRTCQHGCACLQVSW